MQQSFTIGENDTAGEVHDRMKEIGAAVLVDTVKGLADGTLKEKPQSSVVSSVLSGTNSPLITHHSLKHAPKLFTETCKIDFTKTKEEVHNLIRGLSPFPGAFTTLNGKTLKIYRSEICHEPDNGLSNGAVTTDEKSWLKFSCANGAIKVIELQLEGKKKMLVEDFLRGYRF
jgi:methionyl-tRNA formyltransferase